MSLFRRFFYRRPPDGLLEITERVYVFDSCFSTDVFEDETYKIYMRQIATQLHEQFPESSFLVFNFREGEKKSQLTEILSQYDMTVMDYPRQYEGCPILSLEMIHHFLRSSDSWLSLEGHQNILLMHCERGGWALLAFILSCFLIYRKLHTGEQRTLDMLQREAPRGLLQLLSPLNPIPSQLRYLQYVARRNNSPEWPPPDRVLTLDCLMLRVVPSFDSAGGCRPLVRIYGRDTRSGSSRSTQMLFSLGKKNKSVRHYRQVDCDVVKIDAQCHVQGDVVLECIHLENDSDREEMMFRVMFNTAFIRSNLLILNRDDIDILWNAKERFTKDFRAEVLFGEVDTCPPVVHVTTLAGEEKGGLPVEAFARVQELFNSGTWDDGHGDAALRFLQQQFANVFQDRMEKSLLGDMSGASSLPLRPNASLSLLSPPIPRQHSTASQSPASAALTQLHPPRPVAATPTPPPFNVASGPPQLGRISAVAALPSSQPVPSGQIVVPVPSVPLYCGKLSPSLPPPPLCVGEGVPHPSIPLPPKFLHDSGLARPPPPPPPPPPLPNAFTRIGVSTATLSLGGIALPSLTLISTCEVGLTSPPSHVICEQAQPTLPTCIPSGKAPPPPPPPPLSGRVPRVTPTHAPSGREPTSHQSQTGGAPPSSLPVGSILPSVSVGLGPLPTTIPVGTPPNAPPPPPHGGVLPHSDKVPSTPSPSAIPGGSALASIIPTLPGGEASALPVQTGPPPPPPPPGARGPVGPPPPPPRPGGRGRGIGVPPPAMPGSWGRGAINPGAVAVVSTTAQLPTRKTTLKPLHWVKVTRAVQGSLWAENQKQEDETKGPEFDLSELESLFSNAVLPPASAGDKVGGRRSSSAPKQEKVHLIDLRRANNCEIMLTKIKMPMQDMLNAILNLDGSVLDMDQVENLIKFCPTKDEIDMLKGFIGDKETLGKAEQFFLELMRVPRMEAKLRVFAFKISFVTQVTELRSSLVTVNEASAEVRESIKLRRVMQTILSLGNALNQGTARGGH